MAGYSCLARRLVTAQGYRLGVGGLCPAGRAADCAAAAAGLHLDDGLACLPAELAILPESGGREAHIIIREGKFHQIKRMMAYLGKPVLYLERIRMGNLPLDPAVSRGSWRFLTEEECRELEQMTRNAEKPRNFNKK